MKVALLLQIPNELNFYIKQGNTTILVQEQVNFIEELMGLKENGQIFQEKSTNDDEILEVNLITNSSSYKNISYGAKTVILNNKEYEKFDIPCLSEYNNDILKNYDIIISDKYIQEIIEDIKQYPKYHIYIIIQNIVQYNDEQLLSKNNIIYPLQSKNQFKYQEIQNPNKQIALIHYSNYQMRVDEIESIEQINQNSYIRRNTIRLPCLWRELLTQIGKFPKYGA